MISLILSRLVQAIATLLVVSFAVFSLSYATGSPVDVMLPAEATLEDREALIQSMGLDRPFAAQYWTFLSNALRGDFGDSIRSGEPAVDLVSGRVATSLKLGTIALVLTLVISIPLGVFAAVHRGKWIDKAAMTLALTGQAMPVFWIGPVVVLIFAVMLGWLPTAGASTWQHFVLPSVVLATSIAAGIVRLLRSTMLEVLGTEYIKLARSKGIHERKVVWKHALRNGLIPVVTLIGLMYGSIVTGVIVVEVVFAIPGLGRLGYEAVQWRDFPVLQLTVLTFVAVIVLVNFIVDISYGVIDPRVRTKR